MPRVKKIDINQKKSPKKVRIAKVKKQDESQSELNLNENISYKTLEGESLANPALMPDSKSLIDDDLEFESGNAYAGFDIDSESLSNLTLAELAQLAKPYSNRNISTLQRLKREELIYIITHKKDDYERTELSNLNRDSKDFIEVCISVLSDIKQERGGGALNALLVRIFRNQGNRLAEGFVKLGVSGGIFGWVMCGGCVTLLIIDSIWGLSSLAKLFQKPKKIANGTSRETKSN